MLRIAADGRVLGHQRDRLAARRQLQGAERDRRADQLQSRSQCEVRAVEAQADAVGIGGDAELAGEQCGLRGRVERIEMRAADQPDRMCRIGIEPWPRVQRPGVRRAWPRRRPSRLAVLRRPGVARRRQHVACAQHRRPEPRVHVAGAAAEYRRGGQSAGEGEIAARAAHGAAEVEHGAGAHCARSPHRQRRLVEARVELGAGQCDRGVRREVQARAEQGDLERGGIVVIADQRIGEAQRDRVHRAGVADAEFGMAVAAAILHASSAGPA